MSVTWITLLVVNQEDSHIVNIKVSSYKKTLPTTEKAGMLTCLVIRNFPVFKITKTTKQRKRGTVMLLDIVLKNNHK